jgi:hypothetical protein
MITCGDALRKAAEAWGGHPLDPEARRHMQSCDSCTREAGLTDRLLDEIARMEVPDPGKGYWEGFAGRVRERLARASLPGRRYASPPPLPWRWVATPLAIAAALVLVAAASWALWLRGPIPQGDEDLLARMESRVESAIRDASAHELEAVDELIGDAGLEDAMEILDDDWSEDEALRAMEALGDLTALLSADNSWVWSEVDRLVDGLSDEEARLLMEDLDPAAMPPGADLSVGEARGEAAG